MRRNYDYVPDMPHYEHPDVCGEDNSSEDEEQNLERETPTPQGKPHSEANEPQWMKEAKLRHDKELAGASSKSLIGGPIDFGKAVKYIETKDN